MPKPKDAQPEPEIVPDAPPIDPSAFARLDKKFAAKTKRLGLILYHTHRVALASETVSGRFYPAIVRDSNADYFAELDYQDRAWLTGCSCKAAPYCEHVYALWLTVLYTPSTKTSTSKPPSITLELPGLSITPRAVVTKVTAPVAELVTGPEAKLTHSQRENLRVVEEVFKRVKNKTKIVSSDVAACFKTAINTRRYWEAPRYAWARPPETLGQFLTSVSAAWKSDGQLLHPYLEPWIDPEWQKLNHKAIQRKIEVDRWKEELSHAGENILHIPTESFDLRLVISRKYIGLLWKKPQEKDFSVFKPSQIGRLIELEKDDEITLQMPAAVRTLWYGSKDIYQAAYDPYGEEASPLDRWLRKWLGDESLRGYILNEDQLPLEFVAEATHWALVPPPEKHGDYVLQLITAEGKRLSPIFRTISGTPSYYISDTQVYHGPPISSIQKGISTSIPAEALETQEGINLVCRLNAVLPPALEQRISRQVLKPQINAKLTKGADGREHLHLKATAVNEVGKVVATMSEMGWEIKKTPATSSSDKDTAEESPNFVWYDHSQLYSGFEAVDALGVKWQGNDFTRHFTKKVPSLFAQWAKELPENVTVKAKDELGTLLNEPLKAELSLEVKEAGLDWFDLRVVLQVPEMEFTDAELKLLLNAHGDYVRLPGRGWVSLDQQLNTTTEEALARLGLSTGDLNGESQRLHALQLADPAARKLLSEEHYEQVTRRAEEIQTRVTPEMPPGIQASLRPYQMEGFHFLAYLSTNRFGGILADDMGLGKTLQTLTWLCWLRQQPDFKGSPCLVICPKSVTGNWAAEAARFYPDLRIMVIQGQEAITEKKVPDADLIVMNYTQLRLMDAAATAHTWHAVILDEGQFIKNPDSQTAQAARKLKTHYRLALSGTPIENRLLDLWSLMTFAMPGVLGNRHAFSRHFSGTDPLSRLRLSSRVRPFLLRRTKNQVAQDLPDRIEEDITFALEGTQATLYQAELKRAQAILLDLKTKADLDRSRFNILTSLLRLRQICCHPILAQADIEKETAKAPKKRAKKNIENLEDQSAKLGALFDLLEPLMAEGQKVLVFSQFTRMLELIRTGLEQREWSHFLLTGQTENRSQLMDTFQQHEGASVFLISLKAGGFGLNLTAASYVVLCDPWWNPAVENQAIDRTHRIGQQQTVVAYRLIATGTIEEKIRQLQAQKNALAQDILGEERFASSLTLDDFKHLLS